MATAEAPPRGVLMGPEYQKLFRNGLMSAFCHSFNSLELRESVSFSAPTEESINKAWVLFCRLNIRQLLPTAILPSPEGGVALCFSRNDRYADFECFNDGGTMVALSDRHGKVDVFRIDLSSEQEVDDVIFRIAKFLDPRQDALPLASAYR